MSAPTFTGGSAGNGKTSGSLAASASASAFTIDATVDFEARLQVGGTFGTIAATAGLLVKINEVIGSTPVADTVLHPASFTLAAVAGAQAQTVHLTTGKYSVTITNLDATNAVTAVYATFDLTPTVA